MIDLSNKIKTDIGDLIVDDAKLNTQIKQKKGELEKYINNLNNDKLNLEKTQQKVIHLKERNSISENIKGRNISTLIFWSILAAILITIV